MISFIEIAEQLKCKAIGNDLTISGVAEPGTSETNEVIFVLQKSILKNKNRIHSKAWIIDQKLFDSEIQSFLRHNGISYIVTTDIYDAFVKTVEFFYQPKVVRASIHPSAAIHPTAKYTADLSLGPFCSIGENARIDSHVTIMTGVHIGNNVSIGSNTLIYPNVTIYDNTIVGSRVIIHAGTVLGNDGFGYYKKDGRHIKIPHVGIVVIEDDVEIGANCTIDRGTLGETRIKRGTKLDNLIQIAHNVVLGENSVIAAQTGIAGSTLIGDNVTIAGQVGIVGHITIGNDVTIGAQSGVISSIDKGKTVSGYPARDHAESLRKEAYIQKIPEILKLLKQRSNE